jgi:anti-anti-sigma regulatory factor
MLRITRIATEDTVLLKLEGSLAGPWVAECRSTCERELAAGRRLELDLSAVRFVDAEGERFLRQIQAQGSTARLSGFVAELLCTYPAPEVQPRESPSKEGSS